jgi:hypothetical protein
MLSNLAAFLWWVNFGDWLNLKNQIYLTYILFFYTVTKILKAQSHCL